jgi:hypothetical protein
VSGVRGYLGDKRRHGAYLSVVSVIQVSALRLITTAITEDGALTRESIPHGARSIFVNNRSFRNGPGSIRTLPSQKALHCAWAFSADQLLNEIMKMTIVSLFAPCKSRIVSAVSLTVRGGQIRELKASLKRDFLMSLKNFSIVLSFDDNLRASFRECFENEMVWAFHALSALAVSLLATIRAGLNPINILLTGLSFNKLNESQLLKCTEAELRTDNKTKKHRIPSSASKPKYESVTFQTSLTNLAILPYLPSYQMLRVFIGLALSCAACFPWLHLYRHSQQFF